jgi:hypothetical protein
MLKNEDLNFFQNSNIIARDDRQATMGGDAAVCGSGQRLTNTQRRNYRS